jgi:site-specific recombinase XerD
MTTVHIYRATRTNGKQGLDRKKAKSGCWRMKWRDLTGKIHTESTGTRLRDAAKQIARKREGELALDPHGLATTKQMPKGWDDFVEEFIASKRATKRAGTASAYLMSLGPVTRLLTPKNVSDVATVAALEKFVVGRVKEVGAQTVNKDLRCLRAALFYGEERGYLIKTPAFKEVWCKIDKKDPVCLSADVQRKLMMAVVSDDFQPRSASRQWWRIFLLLARETGGRRGELLGLTWDRVDHTARTIKISAETSKGRKDRTLYLADAEELWTALAEWREQTEGDSVFAWTRKTFRQFYEDWARLRKVAGVVGVVPKNLRSTTGSEMVAAGVSTMAIRDWLGHSSITTTEGYTNTGAAMKTAAAARQKWRETE